MAWNPRDALSLWEDAFDVNDHYIHVVIPFDKEAIRNHAMSRFALNEGHGTQLALNNGTQLALIDPLSEGGGCR